MTKSAIAYRDQTGKITAIMCAYDGWLQGVGRTLLDEYSDPEKLLKLFSIGNIVILLENVDQTALYGRTTSAGFQKQMTFSKLDDFERYYQGSDFYYLYDETRWVFKNSLTEGTQYVSVKQALMSIIV